MRTILSNLHLTALLLYVIHPINDVFNPLANPLGLNAVFEIKGNLLGSAALGLTHGALHRLGDSVGIQNRFAVDVSSSAPNRLNQTAFSPQEALFVSIQNSN